MLDATETKGRTEMEDGRKDAEYPTPLSCTVPVGLKRWLKGQAEGAGRTMNALVVEILTAAKAAAEAGS